MAKYTSEDLKVMQSWPLEKKIRVSLTRILEFGQTWGGQICVSFSGGKDSTVLLDLVRKVYPNAPAVFINTGLEYPELQRFVYETDNITMLRPKMAFQQVIAEYGYPLISKEISEAIYYARRKPQRERERESILRCADQCSWEHSHRKDGRSSISQENVIQNYSNKRSTYKTTYRKRMELLGKRNDSEKKRFAWDTKQRTTEWGVSLAMEETPPG